MMHLFQRRFVIAIASLLLATPCLLAQAAQTNIKYIPNSGLSLGNGVSLDTLHNAKPSPFIAINRVETAAPMSSFSLHLVTSSKAIDEIAGWEVKAKARYLFASAEATAEFSRRSCISQNSVNLVIVGDGSYGHDDLVSPKLNEHASALIKAGKMKEFADLYGTHYVLREHRVAKIVAVMSVQNWSDITKEHFKTTIQGKASFMMGGGALKASVYTDLMKAAKNGTVDVQVKQIGGSVLADHDHLIKGVLKEAQTLENVGEGLAKIVNQFARKNSGIGEVTLGSMKQFGWDPKDIVLWNNIFEEKLESCVDRYYEARKVLGRIRIAIEDAPAALKPKLQNCAGQYEEYLKELANFQKKLLDKDQEWVKKNLPLEPKDCLKGVVPEDTYGAIEKVEVQVKLEQAKFSKSFTRQEQRLDVLNGIGKCRVLGVHIAQQLNGGAEGNHWAAFEISLRQDKISKQPYLLVEGMPTKGLIGDYSLKLTVFIQKKITIDPE